MTHFCIGFRSFLYFFILFSTLKYSGKGAGGGDGLGGCAQVGGISYHLCAEPGRGRLTLLTVKRQFIIECDFVLCYLVGNLCSYIYFIRLPR